MSLVSIIIPAFQSGSLIGQTLDSIRRQRFSDWEVVVVEDASQDDTETVVARFTDSVSQPILSETQRQWADTPKIAGGMSLQICIGSREDDVALPTR